MARVLVSFGSNLGDKVGNIKKACSILEKKGIQLVQQSSFYLTKPWGNTNQEDFINAVALFKTDLNPIPFMQLLLKTEEECGRIRKEKWGPRIIDLDILLWDNLIIDNEVVTIPHPYFHERAFVLYPSAEICPEWHHPVLNTSINNMKKNGKFDQIPEKVDENPLQTD